MSRKPKGNGLDNVIILKRPVSTLESAEFGINDWSGKGH